MSERNNESLISYDSCIDSFLSDTFLKVNLQNSLTNI